MTPHAAARADSPTFPASPGSDPGLFREAAEIFLEDGPLLLGALRAAVAGYDARGVERAAQTLAGMAGKFADPAAAAGAAPAAPVVDAARALEKLGRGRDLTGAEALATALDVAFRRLREHLAAAVAAAA
jgi:hypothetical protein